MQQGQDNVMGVFSIEKIMKIGAGTTARRVKQKSFYYVEALNDENVEIQPLGPDNMPSGFKTCITREELLESYLPDPEMYQKEVLPKIRAVNKNVARADRFRKMGNTFSAEFEYTKALAIDERNVRANFGIGICFLERGEKDKAQEVFDRVVKLDAAFEDSHKHLFNEFGINLRKSKMYDEAVEYYKRALEISGHDENLHYNIARALCEQGKIPETVKHLRIIQKLKPNHPQAVKMMKFLQKKGLVSK